MGDQVTVLGDGKDGAPSACDLAGQLGTIAYEILCSINKRIPGFTWMGRNGRRFCSILFNPAFFVGFAQLSPDGA